MTLIDFVLKLDAPNLVGVNQPSAHQLDEIHGASGTADYLLIGLQVSAGFFHYYMRRDGTLARMAPVLRAKPKELR